MKCSVSCRHNSGILLGCTFLRISSPYKILKVLHACTVVKMSLNRSALRIGQPLFPEMVQPWSFMIHNYDRKNVVYLSLDKTLLTVDDIFCYVYFKVK